jgi:tRNA(fMet)-specific endonuclease VapC
MNGVRVALDTSIAVQFLNSVPEIVARFRAEGPVALPMPVVGELFFGAINSGLRAANYARYQDFILDAVLLPVDLETARRYADMRLTLKHTGRPIPENDIWIAATCLRYDLTLVANDDHFSACPGLVVENWTRPTSS